ncbi:MAG: caspase family protein, partial [Gammaproteobacteria bacterium]|nr:caspase family protein [Gammaproteobacteria bacterium]
MSLVFIPEKTKIILIGCSNFPEDDTLKAIKPIESNLVDLKELFVDDNIFNGVPEENVITILNKKDHEILSEVEDNAQHATDSLVIYYAGHGEREKGKTLYLTATNTKRDRLITTAIEFERLNKVIQASKAQKKFIILDSSFGNVM